MEIFNQNSALIAQETALIPGSSLIDGRTEIDRLSFLTEFATVINFYDSENRVHGNWSPFLLKDPAILVAHISKTKIDQIYALFHNICNQIELVVNKNKITKELVIGINHLFDQLIELFVRIERWIYYMQLTAVEYELKKYLIHQVKTTYSKYFWALLSLKDRLSQIPYRHRVKRVYYYLYDNFDQLIWKQNKDKSPYWDVLGLDHQVDKTSSPLAIYTALKNVGKDLLRFLEAVVSFAAQEYESVKAIKGKYPDTLLLRSFVNLLGIYKDQLNAVAGQHLQFYYSDILKQNLQGAVADQVLLFADLAKTDSTFMLPEGTLFNGGLDAQKKPILFEALSDVHLNPAKISNIYTIAKNKTNNNLTSIQQISNPSVIQKDEDGKVQSWKFFGETTPVGTLPEPSTFGFAVSSPLLFLSEGTRTIKIEFIGLEIEAFELAHLNFYLSTEKSWFQVDKINNVAIDQHTITIFLYPGDPEISTFLENPEKLDSTWPMLKIAFDEMDSLTAVLNTLSINLSVTVRGVKTLQLYNDFGAISTKNPYQPFGPTPLLNSSFVIGSNEVFSKPISSFNIKIDWNNLPENFRSYYEIYNKYLKGKLVFIPWINRIFGCRPPKIHVKTFHNLSFQCDFMLLQEGTWKLFNMKHLMGKPPENSAELTDYNKPHHQFLFEQKEVEKDHKSEIVLKSNSCFHYVPYIDPDIPMANPAVADANIQNIDPPFKYTDTSTSGFMKIVLGGISYGFGSALYPNVVAQVATYNSWMIYHKKQMKRLMPAANLPFSPKISNITINYDANAELNSQASYPFKCYKYSALGSTPFTLKGTDSTTVNATTNGSINKVQPVPINDLVFSAAHSGFLFLEVENLVPSESMNLYFELTTDQVVSQQEERKATYYYLNEEGWFPINVMADSTVNFSQSGIVSIVVPTAISLENFIGTAKKYWICIAADINSAPFPAVVLLKPNGLMAQRVSGGISTTKLPSESISKTQLAIPQIASILQPFPSFGGEGAEDTIQMNQRISLRLKTKDRAVTTEDYFTLIRKHYNTIFYSKVVFDSTRRINLIYVVPSIVNWQNANALIPLVSSGLLEEISTFLTDKTTGLIPVKVTNFKLAHIRVHANIKVAIGFTCEGVMKSVNQALILFLSPWIAGNQPKITIDQDISHIALATFIQSISGVESATDIFCKYTQNEMGTDKGALIVSVTNHYLNCSY